MPLNLFLLIRGEKEEGSGEKRENNGIQFRFLGKKIEEEEKSSPPLLLLFFLGSDFENEEGERKSLLARGFLLRAQTAVRRCFYLL